MSLAAWMFGREREPSGLVARKREGKLDWKAVQINATLRRRQIGAFRRRYGEATFELPSGEDVRAQPVGRRPYVTRKLWISIDPTSRRWRVTRVDAKGPAGHGEFSSWSDAVYNALVDNPRATLSKVTNIIPSPVGRGRT